MGRAVLIMAATVSIAAIFLWIWMSVFPDKGVFGRIEIGVVSMDRSDKMEKMTTYLESMPVLKALCRLRTMDETEALDKLRDGELQMVVCIPEDFLENAVHMMPSTLSIRIPQDMSAANRRILSVLEGVERIMLTTESAIMSMYDGLKYSDISTGEMERDLTGVYVDRFLGRGDYFEEEYLSPYGGYTPLQYYGVSVALLLTMLFTVCYFSLYDPETVRLEKLLCPGRGKLIPASLIKMICMSIPVVLWIWIMLLGTHFIFWLMNFRGFYVNGTALAAGLLVGISMSATVQLFVSCFGNGTGQQICFVLFVLLLWLCGGILGSAYYLPGFMRGMTGFDPAVIWVTGMLGSLFTGGNVSYAAIITVTVMCIACGSLCYAARLKRSR